MKKITFILFVSLALSSYYANAQNDLSSSEMEELKVRIAQKVDDFQADLKILAGKNGQSLSVKESRMKSTLNLFIGKGEKYRVQHATASGYVEEMHPAVTMGVITSKYTGERRHYTMKNYLNSLIRQSQYRRVDITQSDAVRVGDFNKVSDNRYIAVAHFYQGYVRYNSEGKIVYRENATHKKVTIYIDRVELDLPDGSIMTYWDIKLGDVEAEEVW